MLTKHKQKQHLVTVHSMVSWILSRTGITGEKKKGCSLKKWEIVMILCDNGSPTACDPVRTKEIPRPTRIMPLAQLQSTATLQNICPSTFFSWWLPWARDHALQAQAQHWYLNHKDISLLTQASAFHVSQDTFFFSFNVVAKIMQQNDNCDVCYGFAPQTTASLLTNTSFCDVLLNICMWVSI